MKATTLGEYLANKKTVTEIDIRKFDKDELSDLAQELSKFDKLPVFKVTGMPKTIKGQEDSIVTLLRSVYWQLLEGEQKELGNALGGAPDFPVKLWDFGYFSNVNPPPSYDWMLQVNLGLDLSSKDKDGDTPALWAASKGHTKVLKLMIEINPKVLEDRDIGEGTPVIRATYAGHEGAVKLMIEANPMVLKNRDNRGNTPAIVAAERGHESLLKLMIETDPKVLEDKDDNGDTPAMWAAIISNEEVVKLIFRSVIIHGLDRVAVRLDDALADVLNRSGFQDVGATTVEELEEWLNDQLKEELLDKLKDAFVPITRAYDEFQQQAVLYEKARAEETSTDEQLTLLEEEMNGPLVRINELVDKFNDLPFLARIEELYPKEFFTMKQEVLYIHFNTAEIVNDYESMESLAKEIEPGTEYYKRAHEKLAAYKFGDRLEKVAKRVPLPEEIKGTEATGEENITVSKLNAIRLLKDTRNNLGSHLDELQKKAKKSTTVVAAAAESKESEKIELLKELILRIDGDLIRLESPKVTHTTLRELLGYQERFRFFQDRNNALSEQQKGSFKDVISETLSQAIDNAEAEINNAQRRQKLDLPK